MIRLDVFSDPVCPWCLIGKTNLDRALAQHPGHPFAVEWHPFQLNPDMPAGGMGRAEYLSAKFGGADRLKAIDERLREFAAKAGAELDPSAPVRVPNTLDAHRLIHWAGLEGRQTEVVAALFRAYWSEGRDIGSVEVLADIAAECGMDRAVTLRLLHSDADASDIAARDASARSRGVNAVPTFLIARQYVVSGAQPPEVWGQIIEELMQQAGNP